MCVCAGRAAQPELLPQPGAGKLCEVTMQASTSSSDDLILPRQFAPGHWKFFPRQELREQRTAESLCKRERGGK